MKSTGWTWARRGSSVGLAVGILLGSLEAILTLAGPGGGTRFATALGSVLLAAWFGGVSGGLFGTWCWLVDRGAERLTARFRLGTRSRTWLVSFLSSLPALAFFSWVPTDWITGHWRELDDGGKAAAGVSYLVIAVAVVVASRVAFALARLYQRGARPTFLHWPLLLAAGALAVLLHWVDRTVLVGLYDDFHYGLAALSALFAVSFVALLGAGSPRFEQRLALLERPRVLTGALLALSAALATCDAFLPRAFDARGTAVHEKLIATGRSLLDFDRDGSSALLGGLDCAAFDADQSPQAFDVPENGIDENCTGSDARWPAARKPPSRPPPVERPYNVLLVTIDAARADHLGAYGYSRKTSPHLDALADESLLFERAFAQSTKTFFSLPSLHTGRHPTNITKDYDHPKARKSKKYGYYLGADVPTLAESLRHAGYSTALVSSLRLLRTLGLGRGFQKTRWTRNIGKDAASEIRRMQAPFFLWMHALHPHDPYEKHAAHDFGDAPVDRYDSELAKADAELGIALRALGDRANDTIVIVTADHGEAFGEHGAFFHAQELYTELLHVPLVVKIPGMPAQKVPTVVELIDLFPTLCELLPIEKGCGDVDGETLLHAVQGERATRGAHSIALDTDRGVLRRSLVDDSFRIIHDAARDRIELYDLRNDPAEQHDVSFERGDRTSALLEELDARPLVRQAAAVRNFEASKQPEALTAHLSVFHGRELLDYVLDRVPKDPSEAVREHLASLYARPGSDAHVRRRIRALVDDVEARARADAKARKASEPARKKRPKGQAKAKSKAKSKAKDR